MTSPASAAVAVDGAGSVPAGSARYPVPSNALYVAPSGRDTNSGTASSPFATVRKALTLANNGRTIVMRRGLYHESIDVGTGHRVVIQNYPGEPVFLDGSSVVSGWTRSGSTWVHSGWTKRFDSTAGYSASSASGGTWIDPAYPMAAHPDQMWINGNELKQVSSASRVVSGTFFADYANSRLVIGSNPGAGEVRASDLQVALTINSANSTVRGIGIRRYATSLPQIGSLRVWGDGDRVENVILTDNATQAMTVHGDNVVVNRVTSQLNGGIGVHAHQAYGLVLSNLLVRVNNTEHFNMSSPAQGGVKVTASRNVVLKNSVIRDNAGMNGAWFDQSSYNITVTGNRIINNGRIGLYTELSSVITVADNYIVDNGIDQYRIFDANQIKVWNNTFGGGTSRLVEMVQDTRRASNTSLPGHDSLRPMPDPTVTWVLGSIVFANNIMGSGTQFHIYVMDKSAQRSASQMGITIDGNLFSPQPAHYADIAWGLSNNTYVKYITAADVNRGAVNGTHNADASRAQTATQLLGVAALSTNALALPADVALKIGRSAGVRHIGSF